MENGLPFLRLWARHQSDYGSRWGRRCAAHRDISLGVVVVRGEVTELLPRAMPTIMPIRGLLDDGREASSSKLSRTATPTTMADFLEFLGLPRDADEEVGETLEPMSLTQGI